MSMANGLTTLRAPSREITNGPDGFARKGFTPSGMGRWGGQGTPGGESGDTPGGGRALHRPPEVRQEGRQQADRRQEGAHLIDEPDAGQVRQPPEDGRPDPAHAEREPEEQPGHHPDPAGQEL